MVLVLLDVLLVFQLDDLLVYEKDDLLDDYLMDEMYLDVQLEMMMDD